MRNSMDCVLIGFNDTSSSSAALPQGIRLGLGRNAIIEVLHVVNQGALEELAEIATFDVAQLKKRAEKHWGKQLSDRARECGTHNQVKIRVLFGNPLDMVLATVEKQSPSLLVLGGGDRGDSLYGVSVFGAKCVRWAPADVLIVQPNKKGPFRRIVACVDFSSISSRVVSEAVRIASSDQADLYLLHVATRGLSQLYHDWLGEILTKSSVDRHMEKLRERLLTYGKVKAEDGNTPSVHYELIEGKRASQGILEFLQRIQADLVLIGTVGKTGLKRTLSGRTVEEILQVCPCSLFAVKDYGREPGHLD
jgi:universal stress protein E